MVHLLISNHVSAGQNLCLGFGFADFMHPAVRFPLIHCALPLLARLSAINVGCRAAVRCSVLEKPTNKQPATACWTNLPRSSLARPLRMLHYALHMLISSPLSFLTRVLIGTYRRRPTGAGLSQSGRQPAASSQPCLLPPATKGRKTASQPAASTPPPASQPAAASSQARTAHRSSCAAVQPPVYMYMHYI